MAPKMFPMLKVKWYGSQCFIGPVQVATFHHPGMHYEPSLEDITRVSKEVAEARELSKQKKLRRRKILE
jgi:hypothetical protein